MTRLSFVILSLFLFVLFPAIGQNKATLELQRKKLLEEIKFNEKQLSQTKTNIKASFEELLTLRRQITLRESLVQTTQAEVNELNKQIQKNAEVIKALKEDLRKLKEQYAEVVVLSYKNQKIKQKTTLVLSSDNFNEAFRRMNYLRKYGSYRKLQAENIVALQKSIEEKIKEIERNKQEKQIVLNEQLSQKKSLDNERLAKDQLVNSLKKQEKTISDDIKRKQAEANKLNKQIEDIIRKEIEAAAKAKKATETTKAESAVKDTPEYLALSTAFSQNKGKLPWPVEKGYVSRGYGQYSHPELKNIKMENNGIDIKTEERAPVRTIFKGKVVNVISNPVYKNAVIINHGEYFSVYSKLATVNVSPNQEIDTKAIIGTAYTDPETKVTEVHLEIWKGSVKQNPSTWIFVK